VRGRLPIEDTQSKETAQKLTERQCSLHQINKALSESVRRINDRRDTRIGVSRRERFEALERAALKPLPVNVIDSGEWITATLHADCYMMVQSALYGAPHTHRHKKVYIKLTEIMLKSCCHHRDGRRIKIDAHFPPAP
jgi:hypothetical protein